MELFMEIFVLLLLIAASNVLHRAISSVPVPLIQIVLGFAAAAIPHGVHLELEPELFFVLFIAPLLFNDGKMTPRGELWRLRAPILLLAFGLVFATVVVGGYAIHLLIPTIPMPAAFALAAILSPTDAVSVGAITSRFRLPRRIMRLLEGEALMNDASALVAFRFAIAAAVTGVFSLPKAAISVILISAGGLLCGVLLGFAVIGLRALLRRFGLEDVTVHILIHILTPFVIYMAAEHAGVSGILAVVAAGIVHAVEKDRTELASGRMHFAAESTWSMILFVLNGLVFLLLGMQLPEISAAIFRDEAFDNATVIGYIVVITLLLIAIRFLWIYAFWTFSSRKMPAARIRHGSLLTSLSGVRGAITLAGALSIPLTLGSGEPFPGRELMIFLAAGVILLSLIIATVLLPVVAGDGGISERVSKNMEHAAQMRVTEAAIAAIREESGPEGERAASVVLAEYLQRLQRIRTRSSAVSEGRAFRKQTRRLHLLAIQAERRTVLEAFMQGEIDAKTTSRLQYWLNLTETAIRSRPRFLLRMIRLLSKRVWDAATGHTRSFNRRMDMDRYRAIKLRAVESALAMLGEMRGGASDEAVDVVAAHYEELLVRVDADSRSDGKRVSLQINRLRHAAFRAERSEIRRLYEKGEINRRMASDMLASLHYRESSNYE